MSFLRVDRGIVRGKKFATRKSAAEFLYRLNTDTLKCSDGGGTCGLALSYSECERGRYPQKNGQASAGRVVSVENGNQGDTSLCDPKPRKFQRAPGGTCRRVYRHGLLWRVTVENIWVSDHASMEDALAGANPIGVEPGQVKAGVIVVPQ